MYPESLQALCQLNELVAEKEQIEHKNEDVIIAVLEYLEQEGGLKDQQLTPKWLGQLIDEHILQKAKSKTIVD